MTTGAGDEAVAAADTVMSGWVDLRADETIQFQPIEIPEPEPREPNWLERLFEWLGELLSPAGEALGVSWPVFKWVLIGAAVLGVLFLLWQLFGPMLERAPRAETQAAEWSPQRQDALALLEDADRLAADGRYDEATHLLLRRSVGQIAEARPDWVEPSSTARELAALPALPTAARAAFAIIAERVERSLFALRALGHDDWQAAREAYADFALQDFTSRDALAAKA